MNTEFLIEFTNGDTSLIEAFNAEQAAILGSAARIRAGGSVKGYEHRVHAIRIARSGETFTPPQLANIHVASVDSPEMNLTEQTEVQKYDSAADDVATRYGVSVRHITGLAEKGEIPGVQVGNLWRFNRDEVHESLIDRRRKVRKAAGKETASL